MSIISCYCRNDYLSLMSVIFGGQLYYLDIVVKLLRNTRGNVDSLMSILDWWWKVNIENLRNNVILLSSDSLDDDCIIERIIILIVRLLIIWIMWILCILSCLFGCDHPVKWYNDWIIYHWWKIEGKWYRLKIIKNVEGKWFRQSVPRKKKPMNMCRLEMKDKCQRKLFRWIHGLCGPLMNSSLRWSTDVYIRLIYITITWHCIVSFALFHYIPSNFTHYISVDIYMKCDILVNFVLINIKKLFVVLWYTYMVEMYIVYVGFLACIVIIVEVCGWDDLGFIIYLLGTMLFGTHLLLLHLGRYWIGYLLISLFLILDRTLRQSEK